MAEPSPAGPRDRAGISLPPPTYPLLGLALGWALGRFALPLPGVPLWARVAGAVVAAAGVGLMVWAAATLARHKTTVDPYHATTAIVAAGPYRFSRNPIYVGFLAFQAGLGLCFAWLWSVLLVPVTALALWAMVIRKEERYLEGKFGAEYLAFKRRVRRWL